MLLNEISKYILKYLYLRHITKKCKEIQNINILDVLGTIRAQEVKVNLDGRLADFVFKSDYNLMPLKEVEKYVKTNNHLPGIPSATEVQQNGLNVGDMQNKLLQKIEELTLYTIEQDKKIRALEEKIEVLLNSK